MENKNKKPIEKVRFLELDEPVYNNPTQITMWGREICYFQLANYRLFAGQAGFSPEDYGIGYFGSASDLTTINPWVCASFIEAYKSNYKNEDANRHFIGRGHFAGGIYKREDIIKRVELRDFSEPGFLKRSLKGVLKLFEDKPIYLDSLLFHVPHPSTKENARNLAENVLKTIDKFQYEDIFTKKDEVRKKYIIWEDWRGKHI